MAELRDRLNKKVLHINIVKNEDKELISNVRLALQQSVFVSNEIGWKNQIQAEAIWYNLPLIGTEVIRFIQSARQWSELPLPELAKTFFTGIWNLGKGYTTQRCEIEFKPLAHTPSKTDGFTVRVDISAGFRQNIEFESDYTCLVNFINELQSECLENSGR